MKLGSGDVVKTRTLILASGSMSRKNPIEGEDQFVGKGVSYCATCDGAFYRGRHVAVVGNNDEALNDALLLTRYAESVRLLSPRRTLAAAEDLVAQVESNEKIDVRAGYSLRAIKGNGRANAIVVRNGQVEEEMPIDGVFIYLQGNRPSTEYVGDALEKTRRRLRCRQPGNLRDVGTRRIRHWRLTPRRCAPGRRGSSPRVHCGREHREGAARPQASARGLEIDRCGARCKEGAWPLACAFPFIPIT